jgi:Flp pilus assembly protein protease CpaA
MVLVSPKTIVFVIVIVAVLTVGYLIYRSRHSSVRLDVDPHASHEIKKAKKR